MYLQKKRREGSDLKHCKKIFIGVSILVLAQSKVRCQEYTYGSEVTNPENNNCQMSNELQNSLNPDELWPLQMQALRRKLFRILTSPALNENLVIPNYDILSDGKLLYDASPFDVKRNIAALMKSKVNSYSIKRSIANLAKNGQLPTLQSPEEDSQEEEEKRGIESLARSGGIQHLFKKSLEALARNGHFLDRQYDNTDWKRNVGALARNGELYPTKNSLESNKRNIQYVMKNGGVKEGKRNIVSLIRNHNMPDNSKNEEEKRNIGAIARDWALPNHSTSWNKQSEDKRNVAALLRQDSYLHSINRNSDFDPYPTSESDESSQYESKRNLASVKAGAKYGKRSVKRSISNKEEIEALNIAKASNSPRHKRQADEYFTENSEDYNPVLHKNGFDYDDLVKVLTGDYFNNKKRFLGNIPLSRMTELGSYIFPYSYFLWSELDTIINSLPPRTEGNRGGKISLLGQPGVSNATPTSPTYRRRQYLLSRTQPEESE